MKKIIALAVCLSVLTLAPVFGQLATNHKTEVPEKSILTKFSLDFPGGTPVQLVKAIEKATSKPLNAIISPEDATVQLPPLKMNDVTTPQLFTALAAASRKTVAVQNANFGNSYSQYVTGYGFNTSDNSVTDTTIWYFHADKPILPPLVSTEKICRFYSLAPYLDRGFTVDDITTAIQTGWKMEQVSSAPELNYHKETKLLIAYGEPDDLNTIQSVLQTLGANASKDEINQMNGTIYDMKNQLKAMRSQIDLLQKQSDFSLRQTGSERPSPPPTVSPGENSGK